MKKIVEKIETYAEDLEYSQTLFTILQNLDESDYAAFLKLIEKSENLDRKLYIDESDLDDVLWDSLTIDQIKIEE